METSDHPQRSGETDFKNDPRCRIHSRLRLCPENVGAGRYSLGAGRAAATPTAEIRSHDAVD